MCNFFKNLILLAVLIKHFIEPIRFILNRNKSLWNYIGTLNSNKVEYCRAILVIRLTMTISLKLNVLIIIILNKVLQFLFCLFFSLKKKGSHFQSSWPYKICNRGGGNLVSSIELITYILATIKSFKADISSNSPSSEWIILIFYYEGLTLKILAFKLFTMANIYVINSDDNTKLPCYTLPLMQHQSLFGNLPPLHIKFMSKWYMGQAKNCTQWKHKNQKGN